MRREQENQVSPKDVEKLNDHSQMVTRIWPLLVDLPVLMVVDNMMSNPNRALLLPKTLRHVPGAVCKSSVSE
jgi:hypothetical protein